jgi:hypothetical protein
MSGELVPFGKYKGQPVDVLAEDRSYCDWLLTQAWVVERFPKVHTLIINNFGEPTETPEHNALQIRLLDDGFRAKCTEAALRFFDHDRQWTHSVDTWDGYTQMRLVTPYFSPPTSPQFEVDGRDAVWEVGLWQILHTFGQAHPATLPDRHRSVWEKRTYYNYAHRCIAVECKPLVGDDYPSILRFLTHLPAKGRVGFAHQMVLAGDVRSQTVSLDQIKQFFALSHVLLVLVEEVEAVGTVPMPRTIGDLDAHSLYFQTPGKRCRACLEVDGRQVPYELPLTPTRAWEVFRQHLEAQNPHDMPMYMFLRDSRILTLEADRIQIAAVQPPGRADALSPERVARMQETLNRLFGREMTVTLIPMQR